MDSKDAEHIGGLLALLSAVYEKDIEFVTVPFSNAREAEETIRAAIGSTHRRSAGVEPSRQLRGR